MNFVKYSLGIFLALGISRFIPHPPNFTSLIALSFYVPVLFGPRFIPIVLTSFVITDFIIGMHSLVFFTWGSVLIITIISKYFVKSLTSRLLGALVCACVFYIITNFGVWISGGYELDLKGLAASYTMAIPFFAYSILSTLVFSVLIETFFFLKKTIARKF